MSRFLLPVALAACASASVLPHPPLAPIVGVEGVKHLSFPIVERRVSPHGLQRRSDAVTATNDSNVAYMIELEIGTPPVAVKVQIDTGSYELWVNPDCSTVSDPTNAAFCDTLGVYDPDASSTSNELSHGANLAYGTGTVEIQYYEDTIKLQGSNTSTLTNVTFGVAEKSDDAAVAILGVGFGNGINLNYNNFIDELAEQGVTNGRAFSLVLGTGASNETGKSVGENIEDGAVIFGGIDTKKFAGQLVQMENMGPQGNDTDWRYWVYMDYIAYTDPAETKLASVGGRIPVVLDSGSSMSMFDNNTVAQLAAGFNATEQSGDLWIVDCDAGNNGGWVNFGFGTGSNLTQIRVPFSDFIWQAGTDLCVLGVMETPEDSDLPALLGDTFLRNAYVVFDQDHKNIYMAQAANCGTNVTSLPAGGNFNYTGECPVPKAVAGTSASSPRVATQWAAYAAFVGAVAFVLS